MTVHTSPPAPNRARGEIRARFVATAGRSAPSRLYAAGGLRVRCPKVIAGLHPDCEAVIINTAGGMVGGDTATLAFEAAPGAAVTITTQSAEKIYRFTDAPTLISTALTLGAGATLEWLPQETILYDGARLERRLSVEMAADASLLLVEGLVFGRLAMGETMRSGAFRDRWRIRRDGTLVFAEELALDGDVGALLDRPALGASARAAATLLLLAPDAEAKLPLVRGAMAAQGCPGGASAWNGLLLARLLAPSPAVVRAAIIATLAALRRRAAPRVWQ